MLITKANRNGPLGQKYLSFGDSASYQLENFPEKSIEKKNSIMKIDDVLIYHWFLHKSLPNIPTVPHKRKNIPMTTPIATKLTRWFDGKPKMHQIKLTNKTNPPWTIK